MWRRLTGEQGEQLRACWAGWMGRRRQDVLLDLGDDCGALEHFVGNGEAGHDLDEAAEQVGVAAGRGDQLGQR